MCPDTKRAQGIFLSNPNLRGRRQEFGVSALLLNQKFQALVRRMQGDGVRHHGDERTCEQDARGSDQDRFAVSAPGSAVSRAEQTVDAVGEIGAIGHQ